MNYLNRPTEERLGGMCLLCLHSSVLQIAHKWNDYFYTEISTQIGGSQHMNPNHISSLTAGSTEAGMTKAALILQLYLNHPINT